jgi:hypothetical protein
MLTFPYWFGMPGFPSDAAIANAEDAAFEREMSYLREPQPQPCADCGVAVPMQEDEGMIRPVAGHIEGERVWCAACFGAA